MAIMAIWALIPNFFANFRFCPKNILYAILGEQAIKGLTIYIILVVAILDTLSHNSMNRWLRLAKQYIRMFSVIILNVL